MEGGARIILITGTPGVGKTTVATKLASRLKAQLVNVGDLVRNENLVAESDKERGTLIADIKKVRARIRSVLRKAQGDTVVEGHYAYDVVPSGSNPYVFVLRRDPDALETSLKSRGYDEKKIQENVAAEVLDVCLIGAMKRLGPERLCEIDTTSMNVESVAKEVTAILKGEKPMEYGNVDWLGRLEEEGRLERFLSQMVRVEGVEYGHTAGDS